MLSPKAPESSVLLAPVLGAVSSSHAPIDDFLVSSGISPSVLTARCPIQTFQLRDAWEMSAAMLGRPDFGTALGQAVTPGTFDILSYIVTTAPTMREAMQAWAEYVEVMTFRGKISFAEWDNFGLLSINWGTSNKRELSPHGGAFFISAMLAYARLLIGAHWQALEVRLGAPVPQRCMMELQHYCDAPMVFTPGCNGLLFDRQLLDEPVLTADPQLHQILKQRVASGFVPVEAPDVEPTTLCLEAEKLVRDILQSGRGLPSLEEVARKLSVGARTLQRRLRSENSSFRDMVESVRQQVAHWYLVSSDMRMAEISSLLGFASPTAFSRAYRNWTGVAPTHVRGQARQSSEPALQYVDINSGHADNSVFIPT